MRILLLLLLLCCTSFTVYAIDTEEVRIQKQNACKNMNPTFFKKDAVYYYYFYSNQILPLFFLTDKKFKEQNGIELKKVPPLYIVPNNKTPNYHSEFRLDLYRKNRCLYYGKISSKHQDYTLLSNRKNTPVSLPNKKDFLFFKKNFPECIYQEGKKPEGKCVYRQLLYVSDLDKNGKKEYWYTQPYAWGNAFVVSEYDGKMKQLTYSCWMCD